VGEHYLREEAKLRSALPMADAVLAPTERTASVYRPFTEAPVRTSPYGIPDLWPGSEASQTNGEDGPLRFLLLGSVEPRKGQDIFVEAVATLSEGERRGAEFQVLGRVMDPDFGAKVADAARAANVALNAECDHAEALEAIQQCDVLVCSSRDEALPVTILEALSLGKAVISASVGGIGEILTHEQNALLVEPACTGPPY
jgi:glycosyltransferase involved in cell wall biosynthesis